VWRGADRTAKTKIKSEANCIPGAVERKLHFADQHTETSRHFAVAGLSFVACFCSFANG